jgi:hypothetical protein
MKSTIENFRALVVLSGVTFVIAFGRPYIATETSRPEELLGYLSGSGYGALLDNSSLVYLWWSWVALYLAAHALAFFFNWFSRPLFLFTIALSLAQSMAGGLLVGEPLDNALWSVHNYIATFLIGMLFFSPAVGARIRKDWVKTINTSPPPSTQATPILLPPDSGP